MKIFVSIFAVTLAVACTLSAFAGARDTMSKKEPVDVVRQYLDAFNKGDAKLMAASFADNGSILDGMAPHVWQGPTAAQDWYRDVLIEGKQHGASNYFVTTREPLHNDVTGDSAYGFSLRP